jgi:UDP-glucose 4-epimerase
MSRTLLVTGGAGFIGSHLVDSLLADGHPVRVLDDLSTGRRDQVNARAEFVCGDVADPATVARAMAGAGAVFHLAAVASVQRCTEHWAASHRTNQSATILLLEAARTAGCVPVVYASSAAVYGDTGGAVAQEDLAPDPCTAYGVDKLGSELHARLGTHIHRVPTLGLRFFNVYGPRQDAASPYSGVISIFARRLAEGRPLLLYGDGTQTRDFVHVADVVAHLRAAMDRLCHTPAASGRVLNVCTGRAVSVRTLAALLGDLRGVVPVLQAAPPRRGDILRSCGGPERATAALGLRATIPLEHGLATLD